ncbi:MULTISPECIES: hypothetical protein [unclassified Streptomyces]|uniref:hypothetical protein n=1 Tax=unclassified Streptomyces TaxID=2593676 RepID=UPI00386E1D9B|nr:hypothetical protein OG331_00205 [Streptomyces sp. NBC_01017]WSV35372.1 hypothetical protein OG331_51765 [Streptomyces sp. NBC_01017]
MTDCDCQYRDRCNAESECIARAVEERCIDRMRRAMPSAVEKKASYLNGWKAAMAAAERR